MVDKVQQGGLSSWAAGLQPNPLDVAKTGKIEKTKAPKEGLPLDDQESVSSLGDQASISGEALSKYAQEREALRFARMAMAQPEPMDLDKVNTFKNLLDSGRINEYLNTIKPEAMVDAILASPTGAALKAALR